MGNQTKAKLMRKGLRLTGRAWLLHNVLKSLYEANPLAWHTQEELVSLCDAKVEEAYAIARSDKSHNKCVALWIDAQAINACPTPDHIIVISDTKMKMATPEEVDAMAKDLHRRALAMLKRESDILAKARRDGQGKIEGVDGERSQPFHDAFGLSDKSEDSDGLGL